MIQPDLPSLQTPDEFLTDLIVNIKEAQSHILLQTMNIEYGEIMSRLEDPLSNAAKRGVTIVIQYDWVSEKFINGNLQFTPFLRRTETQTDSLLKRFLDVGIHIKKVNVPSFFASWPPVLHRNHKKSYCIDEKVWIGGINLFDEAFTNSDFMVKFSNNTLSNIIADQFRQERKKSKDSAKRLNREATLFLDSGTFGKSIIYDEACRLVEEAQKQLTFMSQFLPDAKLLQKVMEAADRNVKVKIITSFGYDKKLNQSAMKMLFRYRQWLFRRHRNIELINSVKRTHAKLLVIDNKVALFGSHNLTYAGVLFGTEEVMVKTATKSLINQMQSFIIDIIQKRS